MLRQNAKQIELKQQELELQKQESIQSFEYAKLALQAQTIDREKQRGHDSKQVSWKYFFSGVALVVTVGFLSYALHAGNQKFAEETLKQVLTFLAAGLGGYSIGKAKAQPTQPDPPKPD